MPWDWGFTSVLLPDRQDPDGRQLVDPARPAVRRPHHDVGRRPGRRHRLLVHPRLGRDRDHRRAARRGQDRVDAGPSRPTRRYWLGRDRARRRLRERRRLGGLRLAGRLRDAARERQRPGGLRRTRRKAATRGSACTASARAARTTTWPCASSTRSSATANGEYLVEHVLLRHVERGRHGGDHRREPEGGVLRRRSDRSSSTTNFTPNLTAEQRDAWIAMWSEAKVAAGQLARPRQLGRRR